MRTRNAKHIMNYIPSPLSHELKTVNPQYQIHIAAVRFGMSSSHFQCESLCEEVTTLTRSN